MKKLLLICGILMASCHFGEFEGIPEATKLTIHNNTLTDLYDVKWNGVVFGEIEPGEFVSKVVEPTDKGPNKGGSPIIFKIGYGTYQSRQPVQCKSLEGVKFVFGDATEVRNEFGDLKTLKEIIGK